MERQVLLLAGCWFSPEPGLYPFRWTPARPLQVSDRVMLLPAGGDQVKFLPLEPMERRKGRDGSPCSHPMGARSFVCPIHGTEKPFSHMCPAFLLPVPQLPLCACAPLRVDTPHSAPASGRTPGLPRSHLHMVWGTCPACLSFVTKPGTASPEALSWGLFHVHSVWAGILWWLVGSMCACSHGLTGSVGRQMDFYTVEFKRISVIKKNYKYKPKFADCLGKQSVLATLDWHDHYRLACFCFCMPYHSPVPEWLLVAAMNISKLEPQENHLWNLYGPVMLQTCYTGWSHVIEGKALCSPALSSNIRWCPCLQEGPWFTVEFPITLPCFLMVAPAL